MFGLSYKDIITILNDTQKYYIDNHDSKTATVAIFIIRRIKSKILERIKEKYGSQTKK